MFKQYLTELKRQLAIGALTGAILLAAGTLYLYFNPALFMWNGATW